MTHKILISYVYHEMPNTKENLLFFMRHIFCDENIYVLLNIKGNSVLNFVHPNLKILRTKNEGFDYGGHVENFEKMGNLGKFDYYVLMNDSACGPFTKDDTKWYTPFIEKLKHAEYVGIIVNTGWFNMIKSTSFNKLFKFIKNAKKVTYRDVYNIEQNLCKNFKRDNILKIHNWGQPHDPFDAYFIKENRIDVCLSSNPDFKTRPCRLFSAISRKTLDDAKEFMDQKLISESKENFMVKPIN